MFIYIQEILEHYTGLQIADIVLVVICIAVVLIAVITARKGQ